MVLNLKQKKLKPPKAKDPDEPEGIQNREEEEEKENKVEYIFIQRPPDDSLDRDSYSKLMEKENSIHSQA